MDDGDSPSADHLIALLSVHDAPCPKCGYNLRGTRQPQCAECGEPIDVARLLQGRRRISGAWVVMLVSYAAALPWSLLWVWQRLIVRRAFFYGEGVYAPGQPRDYVFPDVSITNPKFVLSYAWWLSVPLVVIGLIAFRGRLERLPRIVQWLMAIACVVMCLLAYRRWSSWYTYFVPHHGWHSWYWLPVQD